MVAVASCVGQHTYSVKWTPIHTGLLPLDESKALSQSPFILRINSALCVPFQRLQIHFLPGGQSVASTAAGADRQASEALLKEPGFKLLIKVALDSKSTCHLINLGDRRLSQQWAQKFFHILL